MGLDIGVVRISYLDRPKQTALEFARHLITYTCEADWQVSDGANVFAEYERDHLLALVESYVTANSLGPEAKRQVRSWVNSLPWNGDVVMLHFNW